ncbi:hypothetical protein IB655_07080, partial [Francisella noatunensis]|nr:hypothetical protein [Francisella noatunensis]MBK2048712.1 hypothetical protein [Francisella noatunensis]MBK2052009.1 hypothetical protein [Francisella noatunensis]MBK2057179.1 hypothetical protein [Francisella noatunensis]MBK2060646.1 hypothetical protein [Francisella noatunensis]
MSQFYFLKHDDLDRMISYFSGQCYEVMAPAVRDKSIVYDRLDCILNVYRDTKMYFI